MSQSLKPKPQFCSITRLFGNQPSDYLLLTGLTFSNVKCLILENVSSYYVLISLEPLKIYNLYCQSKHNLLNLYPAVAIT